MEFFDPFPLRIGSPFLPLVIEGQERSFAGWLAWSEDGFEPKRLSVRVFACRGLADRELSDRKAQKSKAHMALERVFMGVSSWFSLGSYALPCQLTSLSACVLLA
jgi:hypothetical protein